ncbi:MAG: EAL domain-containing protein [Christensenella sp.]|nr:EAL domain-containing protein [Christensenella sp.]
MKATQPSSSEEPQQIISQEELQLLLENIISEFSYYRMVYDANGHPIDYVFLAVNRAFELQTVKSRQELIGKSVRSVFPETEQYWIDFLGRVAKSGVSESTTNFSAAFQKWFHVLAYSPKPGYVAITVQDETNMMNKHHSLERTAQALEIQQLENYRLAHEEPITGLPNRVCLYEALSRKIQSEPDETFLLVIIAPDNLSGILASYGSVLSDAIMRGLAQRFAAHFPGHDICFSMTGTDLVLLLTMPIETDKMREEYVKAQKVVQQPVTVDGIDYYISVSCGATCYPQDGTDREELIMKANLALYQAKRVGEPFVFFSEQISQKLHNRLLIRNAMPMALEHKEFELFFQPQLHSSQDKVMGFEALLRWHSEKLGEVSPRDFIGVAEESRLILPIGTWVLKEACTALRKINDRYGTQYYVAVNVSGVQLSADDFVDRVLSILAKTGIEPCLLELEVTESVLITRELHAIEKLNTLHEHGVRIALDDFGTGYSSLSMLKDLRIMTLKIDKMFIQDPNATVLTKMIVRLGHTLGAEIVAEGVETEEQMRSIRRAGCDRVQGFFKGLPMPLDPLMRYLSARD